MAAPSHFIQAGEMAPTFSLEQVHRGYQMSKLSQVYRINPTTVVKKCQRMVEAETMKFIQANTTIPIPNVQNVYRDEESGRTMIVMDYVEGKTLDTVWGDYTEAEQESVISQLKGYMAQLRRFKGDYIGCIGRGPCSDLFFCDDPEGYGPYENEEGSNQGIVRAMKKDRPYGFVDWRCTVWQM